MLYQDAVDVVNDAPFAVHRVTEKKPNEPGRRNRALILRVAARTFARKGFAATTLSEVAELSGLPKANVNYYFHSKHNLYQQVLDSVTQRYLDAFALLRVEQDPLEALERLIRAKLKIIRSQPWAAKVFVAEMLHGARYLPAEHAGRLQGEIQRALACLQAWIDNGQLAAIDARYLLVTLWSTTQAYANFGARLTADAYKDKASGAELDEALASVSRLVLRGLLPR
ncbi:TetR family transcriptional regulator C-terminal domain-containing protein [Pseudomonas sp. BJa5]|uniref:TetR family transcriptional regulator C-terminal domain-containing protein n=1 Tax=Pseudomonas sp. BJa5 TaxID=2936270 RepID=UPI00255996CE|nr:TetR family transcriptional regulator C-terminal domain-containing protein [Pseudomonas sp. BGr12]MDL2423439.1 TetR family transcriptional regulator C-terminal domain-containing protein [Pseudomonas sp. BGr12]